jgi:hypothetical protein
MPFRIRAATPEDSAALHAVCLQTGSAGDDATDEFKTDPDALGTSKGQASIRLLVIFRCNALCRSPVHAAVPPILSGINIVIRHVLQS